VGTVPTINSVSASPSSLCGSGNSVLSVDAGQAPPPPPYCIPVYTVGCGFPDVITNVSFATISNNTGLTCGQGANLGYDPVFTLPNPSLTAGNSYPISVSTGGDAEGIAVWIDFNRNGVYNASELVLNGYAGTNPATYTGNVNIPAGAMNGLTSMRVRCTFFANASVAGPCGSVSFGETEDYNVTITGGANALVLNYSWSPAANLSSTTTNPTTATGLTATSSYAVTVSDPLGCTAAPANVTVTIKQPSSSTTNFTTCTPPYTWNGNNYSTSGTYTYTTTNAVGCDSVATLNLTVNATCNTVLNLTCFIQGYYDSANAVMVPVLFNQGEPTTPGACDSIDVIIHSASNPALVVDSVRTVLQTNGTATCILSALSGNYYIAVRHRNAVQTWSGDSVSFATPTVSYNFSTAQTQAYGSNQIQVAPNVWALYTGDIVVDENVDLVDLGELETGINNFDFGFKATDLNGDGNVDLVDSPILEANISNFIFSNHP
jgi:hypothetical protein